MTHGESTRTEQRLKGTGPVFRFGTAEEANGFIRGRGRSDEEVAMLVASAQMGYAISKLMPLVESTLWVTGDKGPAGKKSLRATPEEARLVLQPPPTIPVGLKPAVAFAALGLGMVDATRQVIILAQKMRGFLEANAALQKTLKFWKWEFRMMSAFALHAAETTNLDPEVSHEEMEALALIVGYRPQTDEFGRETDLQKDTWRNHFRKAKAHILPALRTLKLP